MAHLRRSSGWKQTRLKDVLSRLLYAMRVFLLVGDMTLISTVIGILGLLAGYFKDVIIRLSAFYRYGNVLPIYLVVLVAHPSKPEYVEYHSDTWFRGPGIARLVRGTCYLCAKQILSREILWQVCRFDIFYSQKFCRIR